MKELSFKELSFKEKIGVSLCILLYMKPRYKLILLAAILCIAGGVFAFLQAEDRPEQDTYHALNDLRGDIMNYEDGLQDGAEIKDLSEIQKDLDADHSASGRLVRATASSGSDVDHWGKRYFIQDTGDMRLLCSSGGEAEGCKYSVVLPHHN